MPRLVWFFFDGAELTVYSMPDAAKVTHLKARPRVSLNLDSDGNGVAWSSSAARPGWTRWRGRSPTSSSGQVPRGRPRHGDDRGVPAFDTRLKITIDKIWTTPPEG